jgi:hypothetical protein
VAAARLACGPRPCQTPKRNRWRLLGLLWACPWCGTVFKLTEVHAFGDAVRTWEKTELTAR